MTKDSIEYKALEISVAADKRYRRFLYALAISMFILIVAGLIALGTSISHKIDTLVDGSVARGKARQEETKTIAKETERYNTCIFVIPIDQRTPANQQKCFEAADLPGGLGRNDFTPIEIPVLDNPKDSSTNTSAVPAPSSSTSSSSSSSPKSTPTPALAQSDNPQQQPSQPNVIERIVNSVTNVLSIF